MFDRPPMPSPRGTSARPAGSSQMKLHRLLVLMEEGRCCPGVCHDMSAAILSPSVGPPKLAWLASPGAGPDSHWSRPWCSHRAVPGAAVSRWSVKRDFFRFPASADVGLAGPHGTNRAWSLRNKLSQIADESARSALGRNKKAVGEWIQGGPKPRNRRLAMAARKAARGAPGTMTRPL